MKPATRMAARSNEFFALVLPFSLMFVAAATPALAAGCSFESQGEVRVAEILDSRSFRLQDGREVRLAGIEPVVAEKASRTSALAAIVAGGGVARRRGGGTVSPPVTKKNFVVVLFPAEPGAGDEKRGTGADPAAIKNAESPGDI